jgi:putative nucleotidyltransferase with HDIG domain
VLFVDDEPVILKAFARAFRGRDVQVYLAEGAEEGLRLVKSMEFTVVVSDLRMPGLDGAQMLDQIRRLQPEAIRILVSGRADFVSTVDIINRVGLFRFLLKPWRVDELRGVIQQAIDRYEIEQTNRRLMTLYAGKCAELADLNRGLEEQIQARTSHLLHGLLGALDLRDTDSRSHSRRVAAFCRLLGEKLGLSAPELQDVERGALLHDIGKIGVSDSILRKPGDLTDDEREQMQRHVELGHRILSSLEFLGCARDIVLEHHERFDGTGYPRGLRGKSISMGARIFAVVDAYDAMTSDRPYRTARPHDEAMAEIAALSGSAFDPEVTAALRGIDLQEIDEMRRETEIPFLRRL